MPDTAAAIRLDAAAGTTVATRPAYTAGEGCRVHPTALVEAGVVLGRGVRVWDNVHIRFDATVGDETIIGEKTYIAYGVRIGRRCKLNSFVYVCNAVTLDDGVMIAAGTVFTNDRFPRATTPDLMELRGSEPDDHTLPTRVREGATVGANCTVGCGLEIGRWAMVGMGSVVTRSVPDFALALGSPAVPVGVVCRCGKLLLRHGPGEKLPPRRLTCDDCGRGYEHADGRTTELEVTPRVTCSLSREA